jgi:uncharacterized membrane protein YphA (DoxX/SURF4 family)
MDKALGMQNPMVGNVVLLVSRLLLAGIFVHEGVFLAANFSAASTAMAKVGVPALAVIGTIASQLVAGLAIAVGWHARLGAAALGCFVWQPRSCFTSISPTETSCCISRRTSPSPAECLS